VVKTPECTDPLIDFIRGQVGRFGCFYHHGVRRTDEFYGLLWLDVGSWVWL
jgi:hypothetical protein